MAQPKAQAQSPQVSRFRKLLAALCALIAINLIITSIFAVWAERTLTNTDRFVATVAPLAKNSKIQDSLASYATDAIVDSINSKQADTISAKDIFAKLLPNQPIPIEDPQISAALRPALQANIKKVLGSEQFATLWEQSNRQVHSQLIAILENKSQSNNLETLQVLEGIINLLKTTPLGFVVSDFKLPSDAGRVALPAEQLKIARQAYQLSKVGVIILVVLAVIFSGLSILAANHRLKALRNLAISVALATGLFVLAMKGSLLLKLGEAQNQQAIDAARQAINAIIAGLLNLTIVIAVAASVVAVAAIVVEHRQTKNPAQKPSNSKA